MKTKIRTIIGFVALGTIGFININATIDNKRVVNAIVVKEKVESLTNEKMSDNVFISSAEELTAKEADVQIENFATKQIVLMGNANAKSDFMTLAEYETQLGSDLEIEKYVQKQVTLLKSRKND